MNFWMANILVPWWGVCISAQGWVRKPHETSRAGGSGDKSGEEWDCWAPCEVWADYADPEEDKSDWQPPLPQSEAF